MPPLNLGQQRLVIIFQPDETGAGHSGVGDGDDLVRGAGGGRGRERGTPERPDLLEGSPVSSNAAAAYIPTSTAVLLHSIYYVVHIHPHSSLKLIWLEP